MKKQFLFIILFLFFGKALFSQANINYLDKQPYLMISAGPLFPGERFSSSSENGLFAKNGFLIGADINYIISHGIGIGFNYEYNNFGFNQDAFFEYSGANFMQREKNYASSKFGLNLLLNLPLQLGSEDWVINLYAKGKAGLRTMNIPEIDLQYNEITNKYVEVSYRPRSGTFGYLGYSAGLQLFFLQKYGVNLSYTEVMGSRHSINYSVRKFDAAGQLYELDDFINDRLDHYGFQIGFILLFTN
ncbi:MAG: hypothetical protein EA412_11780 [Chitinophagaceae bacterium]|nr:MAG: hypothetical protein EA412_11780 [Chitinophagaceae bacterium]